MWSEGVEKGMKGEGWLCCYCLVGSFIIKSEAQISNPTYIPCIMMQYTITDKVISHLVSSSDRKRCAMVELSTPLCVVYLYFLYAC